jgi:carboxymethylenebutenolidase
MQPTPISTRDGVCLAYTYAPAGAGPWPAALVFMDGMGIRPAMLEIGERLATNGYFVLLPDLYYRSGPYAPMDPQRVFSDPEARRVLAEKYFALATAANIMSDMSAFLGFLDAQESVRRGPIGITGYCMGGALALTAAGTYGARVGAAASFHGGRLATEAADSPHRLAAQIRARVYIGAATDDSTFPDDMQRRLVAALSKAGVDYEMETYAARHGWVLRDTPVFDAAACERHWQKLLELFAARLR